MTKLRLIIFLSIAEILTLAGMGSFAALLPQFQVAWGLSHAAAGQIESAFQVGYVLAVPFLVGGTDRFDARRIYLASGAIGALGSIGFAIFADGLWSAAACRLLAGIGMAGTFMPGLKILSDRLEGPAQTRAVAWYTACFSLGSSLSVLMAGLMASVFGRPAAFVYAGLASLGALAIVALVVPPSPARAARAVAASVSAFAWLDYRRAVANREALAYSVAYATHMWELYGFRGWVVAFLAAAASAGGQSGGAVAITSLGALVLAMGLPASVLGNEAALRFGRRRVLTVIMWGSACLAPVVGWSAGMPFWGLVGLLACYSMTVSADSASLTAGAVAAARPESRGLTMALHTVLGFVAASAGPVAFGLVLDLGASEGQGAWTLAFLALGLGVALGPIALRLIAPSRPPGA